MDHTERTRKEERTPQLQKITRQSKCNIQRRKKDIVGPQYQTRRGRQIGRTMSTHLCKYPLRCQTEVGAAALGSSGHFLDRTGVVVEDFSSLSRWVTS